MSRSGGTLSPMEQEKILSAVEALRNEDQLMGMVSGWTLPRLRELGPLDPDRVSSMLPDARNHYGNCAKVLPESFPRGLPEFRQSTRADASSASH